MPKMHYLVTNFQKSPRAGVCPLIFDFGDLCFFKLIMTKSNFKKSVITSF